MLRFLRVARLSEAWGAGQGAPLQSGWLGQWPPHPHLGPRPGTGGFQRVASPDHLRPAGPLSLRASGSGLVLPAWWPRSADLLWVSLCLSTLEGSSACVMAMVSHRRSPQGALQCAFLEECSALDPH